MQLRDGTQGFGQYRRLVIGQQWQVLDLLPGVPQALGVFQQLEQQPAAFAFLQAIGQQQRRRQPLLRQQANALQLSLEMPGRLAAHQQLGQHRPATPDAGTDVALPWQYSQQ
ncbi:hypothetical protein D3C78_1634260 [compost metagenome]